MTVVVLLLSGLQWRLPNSGYLLQQSELQVIVATEVAFVVIVKTFAAAVTALGHRKRFMEEGDLNIIISFGSVKGRGVLLVQVTGLMQCT